MIYYFLVIFCSHLWLLFEHMKTSLQGFCVENFVGQEHCKKDCFVSKKKHICLKCVNLFMFLFKQKNLVNKSLFIKSYLAWPDQFFFPKNSLLQPHNRGWQPLWDNKVNKSCFEQLCNPKNRWCLPNGTGTAGKTKVQDSENWLLQFVNL